MMRCIALPVSCNHVGFVGCIYEPLFDVTEISPLRDGTKEFSEAYKFSCSGPPLSPLIPLSLISPR